MYKIFITVLLLSFFIISCASSDDPDPELTDNDIDFDFEHQDEGTSDIDIDSALSEEDILDDDFLDADITDTDESGIPDEDEEPYKCEEGARRCSGGSLIQTCLSDGTWENTETCDEGLICSNVNIKCLTSCQSEVGTFSNQGCVFRPVLLSNYGNEGYDGVNTESKYRGLKILVSNPNNADVTLTLSDTVSTIDLTALGLENSIVKPYESVEINLESEAGDRHLIDGTSISYSAYRLESNHPVFVYQFNPLYTNIASSDASLLLPDLALGKKYYAITVPHTRKDANGVTSESPSSFVIVATQNGTTVEITPSANTKEITLNTDTSLESHDTSALIAGVKRSFVLNEGEILSLETADDLNGVTACPAIKDADPVHGRTCIKSDNYVNDRSCYVYSRKFCRKSDLTGTLINADKDIALFSTAKKAMVPYYMFGTEHLEEQIPPLDAWGKVYPVGRMAPRYRFCTCSRGNMAKDHTSTCPYGSGETFYRIMASEDETEVKIITPKYEIAVEEAPDYPTDAYWCGSSYMQQDWVTSVGDTFWNSKVGSLDCVSSDSEGNLSETGEYCLTTVNLDAGKIFEFNDVFNHLIKSDKAIMVLKLIPSEEYVGIPSVEDTNYVLQLKNKGGDPAMSYAVPAGQYKSSYNIFVNGNLNYGYLGITTEKGATIVIDEGTENEAVIEPDNSRWENTGKSEVERTSGTVTLEFVTTFYEIHNKSAKDAPREIANSLPEDVKQGGGYHTIKAYHNENGTKKEALLGVDIYGLDHYISYSYPGGLALEKINIR